MYWGGKNDIQVEGLTQPNASGPHLENSINNVNLDTPHNSSCMVGRKDSLQEVTSSSTLFSSKRYLRVGKEVGYQVKDHRGWRKLLKLCCKSEVIQNLKCENPFPYHDRQGFLKGRVLALQGPGPRYGSSACLGKVRADEPPLGGVVQAECSPHGDPKQSPNPPSILFSGTRWTFNRLKVSSQEKL